MEKTNMGTDNRFRKLCWIFILIIISIALYFFVRSFVPTGIEPPAGHSLHTAVRSDPEMISRGNILFDAKCRFCHNAYNTETIVGPGLKGILKKTKLPVSGRPAVPDNIIMQLRQPIGKMPAFDHLSEEEVEDIIAFLNTL